MSVIKHCTPLTAWQDELLAELEELEQEELEGQLLDVETPSAPLEDPSEQLPDVRESSIIVPPPYYTVEPPNKGHYGGSDFVSCI